MGPAPTTTTSACSVACASIAPPLPSRRPRTLGRPRSGGVPPRWRRWWDSGPSPPAPAGGPFPPPVPPLRDGLTVARAYRRRASAAEGDRGCVARVGGDDHPPPTAAAARHPLNTAGATWKACGRRRACLCARGQATVTLSPATSHRQAPGRPALPATRDRAKAFPAVSARCAQATSRHRARAGAIRPSRDTVGASPSCRRLGRELRHCGH